MTPREIEIVKALRAVTFLPGHPHKRFARSMLALADRDPERPLTPAHQQHLTRIAWRYRRQIPSSIAYPMAADEIRVTEQTP